jgi:hypothetical protein
MSYGTDKLKMAFEDAPPNVTKLGNSLIGFAKTGKAAGELSKKFGEGPRRLRRGGRPPGPPRRPGPVGDSLYTITHLGSDSQDLDEARNKLTAMDDALKSLVEGGAPDVAAQAFNRLSKEAEAQGTSTDKLRTLLPGYAEALTQTDTQAKLSGDSQAELAKQMGLTADSIQDQRTEAEKLSDALQGLNGTSIDAAQQEIAFRQSLSDLSKAVKENGHSLDVSTEKGRAVKGAFLDAAKAAMTHAQAVAEQKNSQKAGQAVLEKDITLLKKQMEAAGFSKDAVNRLTSAYAKLPPSVATKVDAKTEAAVRDLNAVKAKVATMKGKTLTMKAPTAEARAQLEALGFKIKGTKGKNVIITVPSGTPKSQVSAIQRAIDALHGKTVTNYVNSVVTTTKGSLHDAVGKADGGIVSYYANGGMRENHVAQIARKGSWRVWAEDEAGDEAYIPLNPAKRGRSRQIAAETVKRLGGQVAWFANGGINGFTYTPTGMPVLGGPSDAKSRYDQEIADLKKAWDDLNKALKDQKKAADSLRSAEKNLASVRKGHHTATQLRAAQERVDKAKSAKRSADKTVSKERSDVYAADKELGLKKGAKTPTAFNLKAYETQLNESVAATLKWRSSLTKIGQRGGKELQAMLEGMGEEATPWSTPWRAPRTSNSSPSCPSWRRRATSPRPRSLTSPSSSGPAPRSPSSSRGPPEAGRVRLRGPRPGPGRAGRRLGDGTRPPGGRGPAQAAPRTRPSAPRRTRCPGRT